MFEVVFWSVMIVVMIIIEANTFQFVSIWFAASSLVALICAIFEVPNSFLGQLIVFVIVSCLLLIATRPLVKKLKAKEHTPTNADIDIGKTALVIEDVDGNSGRVKLNGVDWAARSADGSSFEKGSNVTVEKIDGAKLIVK